MELLEREPQLALLRRWMRDLPTQGRVLAVTGEAGAGKSTLLRAATAGPTGTRVVRGLCDPLSTPRPLGPVRDIMGDLGVRPALRSGRGEAAQSPQAEASEHLVAAISTEPTTIIVEDAQWIDGASADVLRFLARRIETLPALLVLTHRNGEIGAGHPLRPLLGEIARLEHATTMALPPLSLDAIRSMLGGTSLDATSVRRLTGGNPFYVSEIARHPDIGLPESVRDAVLASTSEVTAADLETLQLVACAPDGLDDRLLPHLGVDLPSLRRLDATGLLVRSRRGLAFRHELARLAVEESVPLGAAGTFHLRLVQALEAGGSREWPVLTHHADAAGDRPRTSRYADLAAQEAADSGAHTEAAAFLRRAIDTSDSEPATRARMLERLSFELYMVNELPAATRAIGEALRLWGEVGDRAGLIGAHDKRATIEYYSARRREAELHARRATELADAVTAEASGGHGSVAAADAGRDAALAFGSASATRGFLAFRRNDFGRASAGVEPALTIAAQRRADQLRVRSQVITGLVDVAGGATPDSNSGDARDRLLGHIEEAVSRSFDEVASMGFSQLEVIDLDHRRAREAEDLLRRSLPHTVDRDIPICNDVQTGNRARLHFQRGRWAAAVEDSSAVLDGGAPLAQLWPHLVVGLVDLRCGAQSDHAGVDHLEAAWELAVQLDEPLRWLAALSALAERMWTTGADDPRVGLAATRLGEWVDLPGVSFAIGELAAWLRRLGLDAEVTEGVCAGAAEPFRHELEGRAEEAAAWWRREGAPFEAALALLGSADEAAAASAVEDLESLGAVVTAARCRTELRRRGHTAIPPRRRASTRANPSGLTNRQLDVARLLARGLTNAELAEELFISPKTVDHHVSAVLARLGLATRREVIRRAAELGLE